MITVTGSLEDLPLDSLHLHANLLAAAAPATAPQRPQTDASALHLAVNLAEEGAFKDSNNWFCILWKWS